MPTRAFLLNTRNTIPLVEKMVLRKRRPIWAYVCEARTTQETVEMLERKRRREKKCKPRQARVRLDKQRGISFSRGLHFSTIRGNAIHRPRKAGFFSLSLSFPTRQGRCLEPQQCQRYFHDFFARALARLSFYTRSFFTAARPHSASPFCFTKLS